MKDIREEFKKLLRYEINDSNREQIISIIKHSPFNLYELTYGNLTLNVLTELRFTVYENKNTNI